MIDLTTGTISALTFKEVSRETKDAVALSRRLKEIDYEKPFFY